MKKHTFLLSILVLSIFPMILHAQNSQLKKLSLEDVIGLANENSLEALLAKHQFIGSYWSFRSYKANYLPSVSLDANVLDLNRSIVKDQVYQNGEWISIYGDSKSLNSSLNLSVNQSVPFTGGRIFMSSSLGRLDQLNDDPANFLSSPISIGFMQPLFSFNEFKWERKIEPIKYEEAKKSYLQSMEDVNLKAVRLFFDMALYQMNVRTFEKNVMSNDSLYQMAKGRFELGTIDQGDLMQMELNYLRSTDQLTKSKIDLQMRKARLMRFLGYNANIDFELVTSTDVPQFQVDVDKATELASQNNPQMLSMDRQLLEAQMNVAQAKANARFNADLRASYGLAQQATYLPDAYKDPRQSQGLSVGVTVPILDWGKRKGMLKMAVSRFDVTKLSLDQQRIDFDQTIFLDVTNFNMQGDQLALAANTDTLSQTRFDITKQKCIIGKVDVLKLNDALEAKDNAIQNYIGALRTYWDYYYNIRKTNLFDFENNRPLEQDYDELLK